MKMIKKLGLLTLLCFVGISLFSQERYVDERYTYTQHYLYPVLVNPGATGVGDTELLFNYKNKWSSFDGAPKSLTLSYNGDLGNRLGFGGLLFTDNNGALETTKGQVSFSYTISSGSNDVGFGISTEYINHKIGSINGQVEIDDPTVLDRLDGNSYFDVSFGVYGVYEDKIKYGVALPSLVSSKVEAGDGTVDRELGFIFHLGYEYDLSEDVTVEPSMFVKKLMFVPTHVDLNLRAGFLNDRLTGGLTYTLGAENKLGFLIGTEVRNLNIYYGYNVSSREFQEYNNGTHDFTVAINLSSNSTKTTEVMQGPEEVKMKK